MAADALPLPRHPDPDQRGTRGSTQTVLDVDFLSLSADDRCGITAQVNWTLSVATGAARRGTAHLAAPAGSCPAGLPAALSTALGDLADQIVRQLDHVLIPVNMIRCGRAIAGSLICLSCKSLDNDCHGNYCLG